MGFAGLAAPPVPARHAFSAEFDASRPVRLRGKITRVEWINPHSWIHLDVVNDDGTVESWMVEAGPPVALVRRGWNRDSVAARPHPDLSNKSPRSSARASRWRLTLLNELVPDLRELLPGLRELVPDLKELLPGLRELVPDLKELLPGLNELVPDLRELPRA